MTSRKGTISVNTTDIFPIIKKWLYSEHDIFLRELVANATDAITKRSTLARTENLEIPTGKIEVSVNKGAKTITISFWVQSSVTGTFCVGLRSSGGDYGYAAPYTITTANTWQYVTLVISGATAGTWVTNNTQGLYVYWDLGSGSNRNIAASTWTSGSG